jgi:transposase-like protein
MGTRQRFTKEFKHEAVRLMKHSGQPAAAIAREWPSSPTVEA